MKAEGAAPRIVKEKWVKGKNVIRDDVHKNDPNPTKMFEEERKINKGFPIGSGKLFIKKFKNDEEK
jgi:hypothetical protein